MRTTEQKSIPLLDHSDLDISEFQTQPKQTHYDILRYVQTKSFKFVDNYGNRVLV